MVETFAALAEPTRLRIVEFLGRKPRSVGEICDSLSLGQPQASKHLRVLRETGVVEVEKKAQLRIYSLRAEPFREMSEWLERHRRIWDERLDQLGALVKRRKEEENQRGRKRK
jgi:DNA-binding transcriptional ArsR family regulator